MALEKIRGLIIKENKSGDSDKFVVIYAKKIGKISVFARGANNIKSKFVASTSIFTYGDFLINTSRKTPFLSSVDIIESFYSLTKDLDTYYCGVYILEFMQKVTEEIPENDDYLYLALKSLMALKKHPENRLMILRTFQIKMLKLLGYNPYSNNCPICGKADPTRFTLNGFVCDDCCNLKTARALSEATINVLKYIIYSPIDKLFSIRISDDVLNELSYVADKYIKYHLECDLKSSDFIKKIY